MISCLLTWACYLFAFSPLCREPNCSQSVPYTFLFQVIFHTNPAIDGACRGMEVTVSQKRIVCLKTLDSLASVISLTQIFTVLHAMDTMRKTVGDGFYFPGSSQQSKVPVTRVVFRIISPELSIHNSLHLHVALLFYTCTFCCFLSLMRFFSQSFYCPFNSPWHSNSISWFLLSLIKRNM